MEKAVVTPWEVKGNIDYDALIREFGVSKIDGKMLERIQKRTGALHHFLRRGIFFAHRDLGWILDEYEKGNKFFLYTGRSPSGNTHIGHLVPWIFTKWLQDKFGVELYFQFPDDEKFLFKYEMTLDDTKKYTYENMLDVIALGFDKKKTHFIVNTRHANLMYPEALKVAKRITFSTAKASFGFTNETNIGAIFYTSMQAVPAFLPSVLKKKNLPCLIPHAIDQDPHFRVSRDVIPKLGYYKPASIQCRFLPGLAGMGSDGKMSASDAKTAIYTTDDPKTVKNKVNKYAFSGGQPTVEEHRKIGGNTDIDVPYQWLTFFEEDDKKLKAIHDDYRSGKMLTGEIKAILIDKLNAFLEEHQKRREAARDLVEDFMLKP
ncbi:MAG: tryptophan--tRNA ligase [Candidatus Aenigmarchaeota archaeon]|nr:tryptophan--tRNA ligase [Candidatus Aenigmarchaeota archaeon]